MSEAISFYNDILSKYEDRIGSIYGHFTSECEQRKLTFGGRSMYNFLRPNFITVEQYKYIRYVCSVLRNAVTKFKNAALENTDIMEQVGILDEERGLVEIDPGYERLSITSRWDSFLDGNDLNFVELNAECPAGIAYSDVSAAIFHELPFVKDFKKHYRVEKFTIRQTLLDALLSTYKNFKGNKRNKKPTIAIVDWREVPTYTEFQLFEEFFNSKGCKTIIADPRDLTYENGRLRSGSIEIDLVYKRILTNDCVERPDETKNLVKAYSNHDVCMINPFRAKIVHKKSLFASLTHEKNTGLFNRTEHSVISKHIPWTRVIRKETTRFDGRRIDLVEYISDNREQFVIKPNDEYGGKGVLLGRETTDSAWKSAIKEALDSQLYVVQSVVPIPRVAFPVVDNGSIRYIDMVVDMDPYAFGSKVEGLLTRLSSSSLANVTAGGGTTPTFVIERIKSKVASKLLITKKISTKTKKRAPTERRKRKLGISTAK